MQVSLLIHTPEPLRVLWVAARTCYSTLTPHQLWWKYPGSEEAARLLRKLWVAGHHSIFEHVSLVYAVSGVSRALLAQYSRHRIGVSLSVQSQRHVRAPFPNVVPPDIEANPEAKELFYTYLEDVRRLYEELISLGIKKEDARFILPNSTTTNFVTTLNLRSLMDIYQKRVATPGAQWEIRMMVQRMAQLADEVVPELKLLEMKEVEE